MTRCRRQRSTPSPARQVPETAARKPESVPDSSEDTRAISRRARRSARISGCAADERRRLPRLPAAGFITLDRQDHHVLASSRHRRDVGEQLLGGMPRSGPEQACAVDQHLRVARAVGALPESFTGRIGGRPVGPVNDPFAVRSPHRKFFVGASDVTRVRVSRAQS